MGRLLKQISACLIFVCSYAQEEYLNYQCLMCNNYAWDKYGSDQCLPVICVIIIHRSYIAAVRYIIILLRTTIEPINACLVINIHRTKRKVEICIGNHLKQFCLFVYKVYAICMILVLRFCLFVYFCFFILRYLEL